MAFFGVALIYWNNENSLNLLAQDLEHLDCVIINVPYKVAYEQIHF